MEKECITILCTIHKSLQSLDLGNGTVEATRNEVQRLLAYYVCFVGPLGRIFVFVSQYDDVVLDVVEVLWSRIRIIRFSTPSR